MNNFNPLRRDFLRMTGPGLAAAAIPAFAIGASAQDSAPLSGAAGYFDVRTFGATGDGKTLDTPAINHAIEAAAAAGGGTVVFPAGTYLCFSIRLKSHVAPLPRPRLHHPRRRLPAARRDHRLQRRHLRRRRAQRPPGTPTRTTATTTGTTRSSGAKTSTTSPSSAPA